VHSKRNADTFNLRRRRLWSAHRSLRGHKKKEIPNFCQAGGGGGVGGWGGLGGVVGGDNLGSGGSLKAKKSRLRERRPVLNITRGSLMHGG